MRAGIFGWSYPPGCSGPPEEPEVCDVCGATNLDLCICPECPKCGSYGDPECYTAHGMKRSIKQVVSLANANELARLDAMHEERFWETIETLEEVL